MKHRFRKKNFNRRGDVSITILVIGVFAICALAIFSFYSSTADFKESFKGIFILGKINSFSEEIKFYGNPDVKLDPLEVMEIFNKPSEENDVLFSGVKENGNYILAGKFERYDNRLLGFGFGKTKNIISAEYTFKP